MKTTRLQNCNHTEKPVFDSLSMACKDAYNTSLYTYKFFEKYKNDTYFSLFIKTFNDIDSFDSYEKYNKLVLDTFKANLNDYSQNYKIIKSNSDIIYKTIIKHLNGSCLNNTNYYDNINKVRENLLKNELIIIPKFAQHEIFFTGIINSTFENLYTRNYFSIQYQIKNKIPITIEDPILIENVKNDEFLLKGKYAHSFNCKEWINDLLYSKFTKNITPSSDELAHYQNCLNIFKTSDLDLINFSFDVQKNNKFDNRDKMMLNIILRQLVYLINKSNSIKSEDVLKSFTNTKNLILLLDAIDLTNNYNMEFINSVLKNIFKSITKIIKCLTTEMNDLKYKIQTNEYIKNKDSIFETINSMRYCSITNKIDALKSNTVKLGTFIKTDDLLEKLLNMLNAEIAINLQIVQNVFEVTKNITDRIREQLNIMTNHSPKKITTDQSLIETLTRHLFSKNSNSERIPSDVMNNIMKKVNDSISSFYEKRKNDKKANYPKYQKNTKYNISYLNGHGMKVNEDTITVFSGKHINKNYDKIMKSDIVCLEQNINNSKYIHIKDLKDFTKNIPKKDNLIYVDKNGKQQYINKKASEIINGGEINFKIPDAMYKYDKQSKQKNPIFKKITKIEIIPDNFCYNLHVIYEPIKEIPKIDENKKINIIDDGISIDLGMVNLMTIYDPTGEQFIVKGGKLLSTNHYFNYQIEKTQSELKKNHNMVTSRRLCELRRKRENVINEYFGVIVKWLFETYKNKKIIIIGYNTGWKNSVNMGKKNNKMFCQIPYRKLIKKIFERGEKEGIKVVETNESYTSKCDALKLEKICVHENYSGYRCNDKKTDKYGKQSRGLFISGNGKCINSDVNGAINIMRKYCETIGIEYPQIVGQKLYNPKKVLIVGYNKKQIHNPESP